jgi:hypothetical protein
MRFGGARLAWVENKNSGADEEHSSRFVWGIRPQNKLRSVAALQIAKSKRWGFALSLIGGMTLFEPDFLVLR